MIDNHRLGFVIGDVSGKGISASYVMAEVKGIFESLSKVIKNPKELLSTANDILKNSLDKKSFVTALYGIIDVANGSVNFARAGHVPLIICSNGSINSLQPRGIGLGLDTNDVFDQNIDNMEIQLNNDDILILYTDGVTESQNLNDEEFGEERFNNIIMNNSSKSVDAISKEIFKEVSLFSKDKRQHDDITLVLFKWKNYNK